MEEKINIRQFKLMNGEEIIALVTQKEPDSYIVERPFVIRSNIIGGFAFLPWFPFQGRRFLRLKIIIFYIMLKLTKNLRWNI